MNRKLISLLLFAQLLYLPASSWAGNSASNVPASDLPTVRTSNVSTLANPGSAPDDVTDNFIASVQDFGSPNCITTFTPDTHKIHITKATTQAVDWYFIIKQ